MAYEDDFDRYYADQWQHNAGVSRDDLLLDHYPFSVDVPLPPGGRWLELGVGSGRVVDFNQDRLRRLGGWCVGLDYSLAALRRLRATLTDVPVACIVGDLRALPFEEASFDAITLFGTLQALEKATWIDTVCDLTRLLRDGGQLGFSLHPPSLLELIRCAQAPKHFRNITTRRFLRRRLAERGFPCRIERHHVFVIPKRLARLFGARLPMWFGFAEFRRTRAARAVTRALRLCCPPLTFGHWWVWIQKPGQAPA